MGESDRCYRNVVGSPGTIFEVMEQGSDTVNVVIEVVVTVTTYTIRVRVVEQLCDTVIVAVVPDIVVDGGRRLPKDEIGPNVVEGTGAVGVEDLADVLQAPDIDVVVVTVTRTGGYLLVQQLPDVIFP